MRVLKSDKMLSFFLLCFTSASQVDSDVLDVSVDKFEGFLSPVRSRVNRAQKGGA